MVSMALLGAGEFEPWSEVVDRWTLEGRDGDGRVLVVPTAAAPEGDESFATGAAMGLDHYSGNGVVAEVLPMKTREDAQRDEVADRVRGASAVYFSGGNPYYLARTISDTAFWRVLRQEMDRGLVYVGCSAGVACLTQITYDTAVEDLTSSEVWKPGLGFVRGILFAPHWDMVEEWFPGAHAHIARAARAQGATLIAIDERTAMVGDGAAWTVLGASGVHVMREDRWTDHPAGSSVDLAFQFER
jgi:cyanophycinase-like exopeptidase